MKGKTLGLILCLVTTSAFAGGKWTNYSSKDGSFSISFPAPPKELQMTKKIQGYDVPLYITGYANGWHAYMAMRMDFSQIPRRTNLNDAALLQSGVAGMAGVKDAKILSTEQFEINGHSGVQVVFTGRGVEGQGYMMLKGTQMLFIAIAAKPGETDNPESRKFIASFKMN